VFTGSGKEEDDQHFLGKEKSSVITATTIQRVVGRSAVRSGLGLHFCNFDRTNFDTGHSHAVEDKKRCAWRSQESSFNARTHARAHTHTGTHKVMSARVMCSTA